MWEISRNLDAYVQHTEEASSESGSESSSEESSFKKDIEIPLAVLILILYVVLGHNLEIWTKSHKADPNQRKGFLCTFHESGPAILLGLAVGLMVNYGVGEQFDFNAEVFFYVVLPPIIFHQGYALKKKNFFKYFHYIFSFGFLGTVIQFVAITVLAYYASNSSLVTIVRDDGVSIGLSLHECMLMAAVFSAADEVATLSLIKQNEYPKLSAVLFGEGVLNDAMSILLFHTVRSGEESSESSESSASDMGIGWLLLQALYILISAAAVGMGSGLMIAYLLKRLDSLKESAVRQVAILMLGGYLSFSLSEAFDLSGILAVFFCGLTLSHYAWHSLGEDSKTASKITSETLSMIAEAYCFAAIGLSVHEFNASQWCWGFIVAMILTLMIARALSVYGICIGGRLCFPASFSMPFAEQNVLFFGGLVRGAIAWAQVVQVNDAHRGVMVTTSLGVILFTTVFFGAVMPFFTRGLQPEREALPPRDSTWFEHLRPTEWSNAYTSIQSYDPQLSTYDDLGYSIASSVINPTSVRGVVHRYWNAFDNRFMKGLFGGAPHENNNFDPPYMNHSVTLGQSQPGLGVGGPGGMAVGGHGAAPLGADGPRAVGAHLLTIPSSSFSSMGEERDDSRFVDASSALRGSVSGSKVPGSSTSAVAEVPSSAVPATPAPPAAPASSGASANVPAAEGTAAATSSASAPSGGQASG